MSVTANAIFQLFLRASASAAATAFLALSRPIGAPYGFGICASALEAHSANNMANRDFRIVCDMVLLLCLATVVKLHVLGLRARFQCAANLLQRRGILDRGEVSRITPLCQRLDRAPQRFSGARLRQQGHEVYRLWPRDRAQLLVDGFHDFPFQRLAA